MKKIQKICIGCLILGICMLVISLLVFFNKRHALSYIYPETSVAMYDMTRIEIQEVIGIEEEWIVQEHVLSSMILTSSQRIFMFECNNKEKVKEMLFLYIEELKEQFKNSSELKWIENYKVYEKDNFYILIISDQNEKIMEEISERI